jgi:hypothetical protein
MEASEVDSFVGEGLKAAGIPDLSNVPGASQEELAGVPVTEAVPPVSPEGGQQQQPAPAPVPAAPVAPQAEESFMPMPGTTKPAEATPKGGTAPLGVVNELRADRRQLAEENARLKQELEEARTPAVPQVNLADVEAMLKDRQDDEPLTIAEGRKLLDAVKSTATRTTKAVEQTAGRIAATDQQAFERAVLNAEAATRKAHPDYNQVMKAAGEFSEAEVLEAYQSGKNPAEVLYGKAKERLVNMASALGLQIPAQPTPQPPGGQVPQGEQPAAETFETAEQLFEKTFAAQPAK